MKNLPEFPALRSRNYRLYFYGQSVSLIGTWMQRTAVSWVVYSLTHNSFMLGLTLFAGMFPSFLFSLFGGVISDRYNRFRVLLVTQVASLVQAVLLAVLVWSGHYQAWQIMVLSAVLGSINAFDVPARQSLVYEMVGRKEDLPNALALNSTMVNLARLAGPAISGIVLQQFGAAFCFLLNAFSFLAVIGSLLLMKLPVWTAPVIRKRPMEELREGMVYLRQHPAIAKAIGMLAAMSLLVIPYVTLLPVYAKNIFHGDASTFGYINSFIGMGAISGALYLASGAGGTAAGRKKILLVNSLVFGAGLIGFSYTTWFPLAMFFAMVTGFGMMAQTTITNTIIQMEVAPHMRGRVISYFAMAYFGMQPLGSLLIGAVSRYAGAPATILGEGIAAVLVTIAFWSYLTGREKKGAAVQAKEESGVGENGINEIKPNKYHVNKYPVNEQGPGAAGPAARDRRADSGAVRTPAET